MTSVFYATNYGSARDYAEELAQRLGTTAEEIGDNAPTGDGPLIVFSPVHGPSIPAVSFVKTHSLGERPVAVCAVGMTLIDEARRSDYLKAALGDERADVRRFYLPGRLNYSELSAAHKAVMFGIINSLKLKPKKSANEKAMIESYGKDTDHVDFAELDAVEQWARDAAA
ncbi:flavodoxin domain-containing protein [Corynebacterium breve]|uniref:Flavodoxin domain-containing protein n=1 Tax=Corynebacterium breve TaxID=3049799 RepID=A0ABY8VFS1_9CORY|nr:flavodoxin domain-containing protein [Corynebacterium breve]WIM68501.1 flavodoxin domain-containing protein [Corynebacterium breve]